MDAISFVLGEKTSNLRVRRLSVSERFALLSVKMIRLWLPKL